MNVSVPASAPATPPETGASTIASSFTCAAAATARAVSTSMVEASISSAPAAPMPARRPPEIDLAHVFAGRQHGDDDLGAHAGHVGAVAATPPAAANLSVARR